VIGRISAWTSVLAAKCHRAQNVLRRAASPLRIRELLGKDPSTEFEKFPFVFARHQVFPGTEHQSLPLESGRADDNALISRIRAAREPLLN
jgi:hypothetical protein